MTNNSITSKYRLYYNKDGTPKYYSMEDLAGDYIAVDHQTFEIGRYDIIIKDKKIINLTDLGYPKFHIVATETDTTVKCDSDDITLITNSVSHDNNILWDYKISN